VQLYTHREISLLKPKQAIRLLHFYLKLERKHTLEAKIVDTYIQTGKLGVNFSIFSYDWHDIVVDTNQLMYCLGCLQIGWLLNELDPGRKIYEALLEEQKEVMRLLTGAGSDFLPYRLGSER
jgi:hypothetical protein